jgi:hypothetical protein
MLAAPAAYADGMARRAPAGEQPFSWTGFYVGGHAGLATGDTQGDPGLGGGLLTTDYIVNGALYGGQIGYNFQHGLYVFGVEGSWSHSTVQGNTTCALLLECKRDVDWIATVTVASRPTETPYAATRMLVCFSSYTCQVSLKARVTISRSFEFTSGSFQKYSWRP